LVISLTILLYFARPIKKTGAIEKSSFKLLLNTGIKIYTFGYLNSVIQSLNRLILVVISNPLMVGLYMPSLAILNVMKMLPSSLGQYLYPKMTYELGKTGDKKKIWKWVWKSAFILIIVLIPFGIIGWYALPPFVEFMFPKYIEGIRAAQLSIISGIISGSLIGINVINSLKAYRTLAVLTTVKFVLYVGLMYLFTRFLDPLTGIALGMVIADLLYFIVALYACYYNLIIYEKHE
jgi:O-antigen/teichoic acid export membrane protein